MQSRPQTTAAAAAAAMKQRKSATLDSKRWKRRRRGMRKAKSEVGRASQDKSQSQTVGVNRSFSFIG